MKAKFNHLPMKAYEVYFCGEPYGVQVGRTAGQAKAAAARNLSECYEDDVIWRNLSARSCQDRNRAMRAIEKDQDRGKYWRDMQENMRLQAEADAFNEKYPVGTPVQVTSCEASTWPDGITTTRTPAWVSGPGSLLVSVEGYAGGFYLDYIKPLV